MAVSSSCVKKSLFAIQTFRESFFTQPLVYYASQNRWCRNEASKGGQSCGVEIYCLAIVFQKVCLYQIQMLKGI